MSADLQATFILRLPGDVLSGLRTGFHFKREPFTPVPARYLHLFAVGPAGSFQLCSLTFLKLWPCVVPG